MSTEGVAATEGRRVTWFQIVAVQVASIVLLGIAIFSLVYAFAPNIASRTLVQIGPSNVFRCRAREGDLVAANFMVKNVTSQPIRLLGLKAGCSCTVGEGLPLDLAAGGSGEIRVNLRVGHFDKTKTLTRSAELLANRAGTVPPLVIEVSEGDPPKN